MLLRNHATDIEGDSIKEIIEDARLEDRNHFEALVPRIYELSGKLPNDIVEFSRNSACMDAKLPSNPTVKKYLESAS